MGEKRSEGNMERSKARKQWDENLFRILKNKSADERKNNGRMNDKKQWEIRNNGRIIINEKQ
jgi:hypothetical protein